MNQIKTEKKPQELIVIADYRGLASGDPQVFIGEILRNRVFDGESRPAFWEARNLNWKSLRVEGSVLMEKPTPLRHKLAQGRVITGVAAYEEGR
jgi:type I restriction enzyme R subunit